MLVMKFMALQGGSCQMRLKRSPVSFTYRDKPYTSKYANRSQSFRISVSLLF
jgi:hypothetical protein